MIIIVYDGETEVDGSGSNSVQYHIDKCVQFLSQGSTFSSLIAINDFDWRMRGKPAFRSVTEILHLLDSQILMLNARARNI